MQFYGTISLASTTTLPERQIFSHKNWLQLMGTMKINPSFRGAITSTLSIRPWRVTWQVTGSGIMRTVKWWLQCVKDGDPHQPRSGSTSYREFGSHLLRLNWNTRQNSYSNNMPELIRLGMPRFQFSFSLWNLLPTRNKVAGSSHSPQLLLPSMRVPLSVR